MQFKDIAYIDTRDTKLWKFLLDSFLDDSNGKLPIYAIQDTAYCLVYTCKVPFTLEEARTQLRVNNAGHIQVVWDTCPFKHEKSSYWICNHPHKKDNECQVVCDEQDKYLTTLPENCPLTDESILFYS